MQRSIQKRTFPIPAYLSTPSYGIDISDESLKFVQLVATKKGVRLGNYGERKIPSGVIDSGSIKDPKKLGNILADLHKQEGITHIRLSLPEEQIYIVKINLDKAGLKSVREGIELVLEDHIPMPAQESVFDYEILEETDKKLVVQVVAIQRGVVEAYIGVFESSGLIVESAELEAQAISRSVIKRGDMESYMIVDFGEKRTGIFIVSRNAVAFTSTLEFGGVTLTNMLEKSFNVSFEEAEKIKKEYGLQRNLENKEIFPILLNGLSILRDEISKHLVYWHTHTGEEGKTNPPVKRVIICGGNANITGLSDYLSVSLKTKTEVADVWANILSEPTHDDIPAIGMQESLSYATALGLALGDFRND